MSLNIHSVLLLEYNMTIHTQHVINRLSCLAVIKPHTLNGLCMFVFVVSSEFTALCSSTKNSLLLF